MSRRTRFVVVALLAALATTASLAIAEVFQPGTQPAGDPDGLVTPIQGAVGCTRCHGLYDLTDDYEPWDSWRGSMMANAGRDPVFFAALAIAEQDHPDAADFCIRCHSPPAWLEGRSSLPEWSAADGPRLAADEDGFPSNDRDGVTCMVCHRIDGGRPPGAPMEDLANAQIYYLDDPDGHVRLGPYDYPPGGEPAAHPVQRSDHLASSELCGACHDIYNPIVMGRRVDGTPTGRPFAIERTYSEWQRSAFSARGETCQSCHMVEMEFPVRAEADGPLRDYFRRHDLVGGNYWVPRAIASMVDDTEGNHTSALEATADRALEMLERAATVEITDSSFDGATASATVRVTNLTGHKLPTGYPEGRRMWLEVAVVDSGGTVLSGVGLFDDATGDLVDAADPQLRTYEIKLGEGSKPSFHFILNDTVLEDTRIPPEGFDPLPELDIDPVGRDYTDGAGGYRHWDEASFSIPVTCGEGELSVRARLRFQATTREYIEFLRDNAPDSLDPDVGNWGQISYDAWLAHGGDEAADMAEASAVLGEASMPCPTADAGVAVDGGGGGGDAGTTPPPPGDDGGCCSTAGTPAAPLSPAWLALACLAGFLLLRRRR